MSEIQRLFDALSDASRATRGQYHKTLGAAVATLSDIAPSTPLRFDTGGAPGNPMSYRGYYDDLALAPDGDLDTAGKLLGALRSALGGTFTGYKGGDYIMDEKTPLWVSSYGEASGVAIMEIVVCGDEVVITTRQVD